MNPIEKNRVKIQELAEKTLIDVCVYEGQSIPCLFNKEKMIVRLPYLTLICAGMILTINNKQQLLIKEYHNKWVITIVKVEYTQTIEYGDTNERI